VAAPSSTAVPQAPEPRAGMASVRKAALPEPPEPAAPCIPRARHPAEHPQARVPVSASVPEWAHAPASASVPVPAAHPASCRPPVKRRVRSAPARMRVVDASNIRRLKKAR
jgi:hypothetical protein